MKKMPVICHRCKQPIQDTSKAAAGYQWHPECYWCDACRHDLDYASVYYGNEILCLDCFTEKSVCAERDAKFCKSVSPPTSMHNGFLKKPWEQIYHTTTTEDGVRVHHFAPCSGLRFSVQPRRPPSRAAAHAAFRNASQTLHHQQQQQQQYHQHPRRSAHSRTLSDPASAPPPPPSSAAAVAATVPPPPPPPPSSDAGLLSVATEPPPLIHSRLHAYEGEGRLRDTTSAPDTRRGRSPREVLRSDERREAAWNKFAEWLSPETPPQEAPPPHLVLPVPPPPRPPRYSPGRSPCKAISHRRGQSLRSRSPSAAQSVPTHTRQPDPCPRKQALCPPPLTTILCHTPANKSLSASSPRGGSLCSTASSRLGGRFSKGPGCRRCGKTVYHAERMLASGGVFHNTCFSCYDCKKPLEVTTMFEGSGEIFCKPCGTRKFGPVGYGYGSGAGALQTL